MRIVSARNFRKTVFPDFTVLPLACSAAATTSTRRGHGASAPHTPLSTQGFMVFVLLVVSFAHDLFFKREVSTRKTPEP